MQPIPAVRRPIVLLASVALLGTLLITTASSLQASPVANDVGGGVECRILNPNGDPVTQVRAASFGDPAYWLEFRSSGALATTVQFRTAPLFEGSPALGQVQNFNTDDSNVVTTPFGVPDWGRNMTSGPWGLRVRDNLGRSATCRFEVVP